MVEVVRDNNLLTPDGYLPRRERMALDLALRISIESGDAELGLQAMSVLAGSRIAQANRLLVDRLINGDPALATRVKALQDQVQRVQLADAAYLIALGEKPAEAGSRKAGLIAASASAAALRAGLARDYPRWSESRGARPVGLAALQRGLGGNEGLLAVVPAFDGLYVLAATSEHVVVVRSKESRAAMEARVARFRTSMAAGSFDAINAADLYTLLMPPPVLQVLAKARRLRVVPVGAFAALPFAALLERPVTRPDAALPWLIRRYALSVAADFGTPAPAARDRRVGRPLLAIGAPAGLARAENTPRARSAAHFFRGAEADAINVAALPQLPGALREIERVIARYGPSRSTRLVGDDATEARLRALDLRRYGTLLFATHGLVTGQMEGLVEPALVMTRDVGARGVDGDGLLTASEVQTLELDADWVILSACDTAAGQDDSAPAYSGLAQAFRYAGARSLLISHWPVRDDVAGELALQVIATKASGLSPDIALQRAMLRLIRSDRSDPFLWAPFILAVSSQQ